MRVVGQVAQLVERSPEKAGVGGSIPSLATIFPISYNHPETQFHSDSFQNPWSAEVRFGNELECLDRFVIPLSRLAGRCINASGNLLKGFH